MPQVSHSVPLTTNTTADKPMPIEWIMLNNKPFVYEPLFLLINAPIQLLLVLKFSKRVSSATAFAPTKEP